MLGIPITHDEAFESQLGLQPSVQRLTVLAPVRVIQPIVRAHDGSGTGAHSICKGPEINLVNRLVIDVAAAGGNRVVVGVDGRITVQLLLVSDVVLSNRSDDGRAFDSL
jgi:hypothetical protein